MDTVTVMAAFEEQVRRNPQPAPGEVVEREPHITRLRAPEGGWSGVCWSALEGLDVDAVIAAQIERFGAAGWEWKHYSHDQPPELSARLTAAGFQAGPVEAVLVAEVGDLAPGEPLPEGIRLEQISDAPGARALVAMQDEVFGRGLPGMAEWLVEQIAREPQSTAAIAALAGETLVAGGRVDFNPGSDFAGLWGGATLPAWRSRGIFRALVAHRASLAAARGYRYLHVDASEESRPILERLGFTRLASTTPFTYRPAR